MREFEVSSGGCNDNDVLGKKGTSFLFILVIILAHQRPLVKLELKGIRRN